MMYLNQELIDCASEYLQKKDRIALHKKTGIKMSGVYTALRGKRQLTQSEVDEFQKVILEAKKSNS